MNFNFKLTPEEVSIFKIVSKHYKFKHFKNPKTVYMKALEEALGQIAK